MNRLDLRTRVMMTALVPAAIIAILLTSFFVSARFSDLDAALRNQDKDQARHIAAASEYGVFSGNRQSLQSLTDATLAQSDVVAVSISGMGNQLLARSVRQGEAPPPLEMPTQAGEYEEKRGNFLIFSVPIQAPHVLLEDDSLDPGKRQESERGRVWLVTDRASLMQQKLHLFLTSLGASFLVLVAAGIVALRMSRKALQPMDELEQAVERISQGDFDVRIGANASGSIGRLTESLNRMATQLAASHEDMIQRIGQATEELRLRKEDAERANVAKSRFLAAASHDLRQPMHALGLFVGQLQQRVVTSDSRQLVDQIAQSVKALGGLLDGLLDISKLDAGVLTPEASDFPLVQVLTRLESDFSGTAEAKNLYLRVRQSKLWVHTDPVLLERVLLNLVSNAVRYTEQGGILIGCRRRGDRVRIEVRDSGIGIPADAQESVFHEFVQLKNPGRNRSQGLGLGLAIVKRLVSLLGLRLDLRSSPGSGSVFAIEVPAAKPVERRTEERSSRSAPGMALEGKVVAAVDDDELVLASVTGLLESWGCVVLPAASGSQALERVRSMGLTPDALLCDYRLLEGEKGTDVIAALRKEFGETIPAILISGDTDPDVLRMAQEAGLSLLHKPVSSPKLRTLLHRMIGKA